MLTRFSAEHEGQRLDRALTQVFPQYSRSFLAKLIDDRRVRLNGITAEKSSQRVSAGQNVEIDIPPPADAAIVSQDLPLKILYDDQDIVVVDKPAGLVVHPAAGHADRTLVNALMEFNALNKKCGFTCAFRAFNSASRESNSACRDDSTANRT